ncbi:MAG: phosphoglycerate kinase [Gammaproteobacteria bacterium]|nr:phosphoglycerate kinase [Gammaproteobacteria bacterium]
MINLTSLDITNKNLVIRVDMNVPIKDGIVADASRIKACIPTIKFALENNAKVLLISHLGRPEEGIFEEKFSMKPVAESLSSILNEEVGFIEELESKDIFKRSLNIQILENIRFFEGEKSNDKDLGNKLANLGDIYVFDAFGTAHRQQASTYSAIEQSKIACAGLLLEREIDFLTKALNNYQNPYLAIIGGAKVSTKLELIKHINNVADNIIVGGGIANTFILASGLNVGKSLVEETMVDIAKSLLDEGKIILPKVAITSESFEGKNINKKLISDVKDNEMILDLYIEEESAQLINESNTILWNGPMGVFENKAFEKGTKDLASTIAKSKAFSLAGGGETLSAINKYIKSDDVSYCSTGGGAFLEFMEGKTLPAIKVLNSKENGR